MASVLGKLAEVDLDRHLAAYLSATQRVQADAACDGRQPTAQIIDGAPGRPLLPQPGLLHGVLGVGVAAQHALRKPPQRRSIPLELGGDNVRCAHTRSDAGQRREVTASRTALPPSTPHASSP